MRQCLIGDDVCSPQQPHVSLIYVMTSQSCGDRYVSYFSYPSSIYSLNYSNVFQKTHTEPRVPRWSWTPLHTRIHTYTQGEQCNWISNLHAWSSHYLSGRAVAYIRSRVSSGSSPSWLACLSCFPLRTKLFQWK